MRAPLCSGNRAAKRKIPEIFRGLHLFGLRLAKCIGGVEEGRELLHAGGIEVAERFTILRSMPGCLNPWSDWRPVHTWKFRLVNIAGEARFAARPGRPVHQQAIAQL